MSHRAHGEPGARVAGHARMSALIGLLCVLSVQGGSASGQNLRPDSGKDCGVCHLEWVEAFKQPGSALLMPAPEKPVVAESDMCLSCHDGSVADSRKQVWLDHGHKTGVTPSAGMKVPDNLPLEEGKLACRTCHTAHAAGGGTGLKDAVFLRVRNESGQLCTSCHTDKSQGPLAGTHPLGKLPGAMPAALVAAGAHGGADGQQLVCQTCHTSHGSRADRLLVLAADSSQLCLACHEQMKPGVWRGEIAHNHPQNPPLRTAAHQQAIKDMGTRMGPDNTMICLSCHKLHHGQSGKAMLADTLQDSGLCIRCHPERQGMAGSTHDLRKSAPTERNAKGQTAVESGPCGSCHTFHSYARKTTPGTGDPQGLCTTCHSEGQVASRHTGQPFSHPSELDQSRLPKETKLALYPSPQDPSKKTVACLSCHDPHEKSQPHFLRSTGDALCANCHAQKVQSLAGDHDFSRKNQRNAQGRTGRETGKCGFCHAVHNARGPAMWVATNNAPASPDAMCTECHRAGGLANGKRAAQFNHPTGPQARGKDPAGKPALPLYDAQGHRRDDGFVACGSCHDLHANKRQARAYLRNSSTSELCVTCHPQQGAMAGSAHDARKSDKPWPGARRNADLCTACHRPHSNDPARKTWAVAPQAGLAGGDGVCASCHSRNTWSTAQRATEAGAMMHTAAIPAESPVRKATHALPLRATGNLDAPDELACQTCHNPHATGDAQYLLRIQPGAPASNLCLACHTDARHIDKGMHSREFLDPDNKNTRACSPCHATHAQPGSAKKLLWAARTDPRGVTESEQLCLGCHSPNGGAKPPTMFRHPETALQKLRIATTQPSELQQKLAMIGQITCSTCHLSHGREIEVPASTETTRPVARTLLSAIKPMLKPDVDRNLCATCHGIDATRVYLYFHNPAKRERVQQYVE